MKKLVLFISIIFFAGSSCHKKYDIEADRQALVKLSVTDWDANFLSGNPEANANFYTENAVRIWDGKVYSGKESIRTLLGEEPKEYRILKFGNKVEDTRISGDLATVRGSFEGSFVQKMTGDTSNIKETWVDICERQADGTWKMVLTIITEMK